MLIDQHLCFVSNPKTGSTSAQHALSTSGIGKVYGERHMPAGPWLRNKHWVCGVFVRNPFDRLVSGWAYTKRNSQISFSEWLRGEAWYAGGVDFKRTSQAYWANFTANFVMRFEHIEDDWGAFLRRAGLPQIMIEHKNGSEHPHYREIISQKDRAIIEDRFAHDLVTWGYEF